MSERESLIAGYFDGDLDAAGRRELSALLERDAGTVREFDAALRLEALLRAVHGELPANARLAARVRGRTRRHRFPWRLAVAAVAAAVLAAATGAWLGSRESADHQVLAGRVLVGGQAVRRIPEGTALEVAGNGPATIRLADGSRATLAPSSRAVLRGRVGELRQVVKLDRGKGDFKVKNGARKFRVDTPVGKVTVLGTEFSVELRPPASKGEKKMKSKMALALVVAVTAGSVRVDFDGREHVLSVGQQRVFGGEREGGEKKASGLPESVRGFSGMVRGVVVAKGEKHTFTFKVGRVLKVWDGSKAKKPQALVGLTIKVGPRWTKSKRGKWHPVEAQVLFIRKLKAGQELSLEVRNVERDHFAILELSKEQQAMARGGGEGEKKEGEKKEGEKSGLPEGVRGFSGRVRGVVAAKGEKHTFTFKVGRVLKTWKGNKARRPAALVGQTIKVGPRWQKNKRGKWRPVEVQVLFIRKLKPGHEFSLEVRNVERDHFAILELSKEQRAWALRGAGKREGERREGEKREGEKKENEKKEGEKKEGEEKEGGGGDDWAF